MKKMLLLLPALFAASIASAQSYAKQPDPSTYQVVEYKPAVTDTIASVQQTVTQPATMQSKDADARTAQQNDKNVTQPTAMPEKKVVQNRKKK